MPWRCDSCGGENPEGMRFCGHCGAPIPASGPPAEAPPAPSMTPAGVAEPEPDALRAFVTGQVADRLIESGGELTEERRLVTALFADLSGFTPLSERLDPEELLEVIDPIIRALSDIVGRYEGFVEKFAGDAVLALFGAPVAHEDDAARAVLVATEMHRELAHLRTQLGADTADLTLHIGINTGHGVARMIGSAVRTDYAVLGDSVILAQRLESAAPPGETYIGETTHRLVRDRFELEPLEPLTLKGKSEPVPAYRLIGERAAAERSTTGVRRATPLIGRDEEVGALRAVLDTLAAGTGGVVSVIGEPGVGKSRLTDEARAVAAGHGTRWLEARCLSYGAGLAYWPFLDLLRRVAGIRVDDPLDEAATRLEDMLSATSPDALPFFARVLGLPSGGDDELAQLEPEAFRRGLHDALARWLRVLGTEQPVVLALEDCHWADASTIALTLELARALREDRIVLYLTARAGTGRLVDEMTGTDAHIALALHLKPLDAHGVAALADHLLDGTPPPGLLPLLFDRGAGNPFFVEETVRSLLDSGALLHTSGRWELRPGWDASEVAPTIEGVLAARIDVLPTRAARLLGVASVIGRRVRMALLRAVVSDGAELDTSLGQLLAAGFLDEGTDGLEEAVIFHHALMQEVAYGRLLRRRRRDLHLRTAEAAERLWGAGDDVIDLVARHLYLGEAGSRAIDYLIRAGERARSLFANDEAIVHFSRAIELVRADQTMTDRLSQLLLTLADLQELIGDYAAAYLTYERARDAGAGATAWAGIASTLRRKGQYVDALEAVEAALGAFTDSETDADLRPLWLERGWSLVLNGSAGEAIHAFEDGLGSTDTKPDAVTGRLLIQLARAESMAGMDRQALEHAMRAQDIFEQVGEVRGLATALRVRGGIHHELADDDAAANILRQALEVAERVGTIEEIGGSLINLGLVERDRGDLDAAIACDLRAIDEFERIQHGAGRTIGYANLAEKLVRAGRLAEAEHYNAKAAELATAMGNTEMVGQSTETLGEIRMAQERYDEAMELLEQAAGIFLNVEALPPAIECLELAAEAARKAGNAEEARELANRASSLGRGTAEVT